MYFLEPVDSHHLSLNMYLFRIVILAKEWGGGAPSTQGTDKHLGYLLITYGVM